MSKQILIVDDERPVGTLLAHTLDDMEDAGVEIVVADDTKSALALCAQAPDLVFVAADQPGGIDLCRSLRDAFPGAPMTIVLLADKGHVIDADLCAALGVTACVEKPFDPDRIRALACDALGFQFDG